jgi:hypothetical protein
MERIASHVERPSSLSTGIARAAVADTTAGALRL